jgi:hypothetical protein
MTVPALNVAIQGQGTISADNLNTFIQTSQMASQLRTIVGLPGMVIQLQGISFPNDGYEGFFYWNANGTEPDDNMNYIVPTGTTTGEWERLTFELNGDAGLFTTLTVTELATFESDVIIGGILSESFAGELVGAGSTQGTATPLTANINIATAVSPGTGFILPLTTPSLNQIKPGTSITLLNRGTNIANLYPPSGGEIESLGVNNPVGVSPGGSAVAIFGGSTRWWIE